MQKLEDAERLKKEAEQCARDSLAAAQNAQNEMQASYELQVINLPRAPGAFNSCRLGLLPRLHLATT